jgi:hypothetical protein
VPLGPASRKDAAHALHLQRQPHQQLCLQHLPLQHLFLQSRSPRLHCQLLQLLCPQPLLLLYLLLLLLLCLQLLLLQQRSHLLQ